VVALRYHQATKHHFNRFARSLGYLDWATQPDPFRRYADARRVEMSRDPLAVRVPYSALYGARVGPCPFDDRSLAEFLRCSMGLSAWKQYRESRWALRVNPSSGNLHPTEAYVVRDGEVCHYAPREHALEVRAVLDRGAWLSFTGERPGFLIALTSVPWREAWKYGERAFRYCQHDTGHAIAAMRLAAAMLGWSLTLLPRWSDTQISTLLGLDRDNDFETAEPEEPECLAVVAVADLEPWREADPTPLVGAARAAGWQGRANRLSPDHVPWQIIDEVGQATRYPGLASSASNSPTSNVQPLPTFNIQPLTPNSQGLPAREVILKRRSAVAFDARSTVPRERFFSMLARVQPCAPPWDAIDWPPHVHLVVFVHRVAGLTPGVYAYLRAASALDEWRQAMRPEFLWERISKNDPNDPNDSNDPNGLYLLFPSDVIWPATRVSCDQDIAGDGFFSLGMIARLEPSLSERGEWFYRRLFWECGMIGHVLYLEAEAAGARGTGIGCFYDDAVHELFGLTGERWQSLYHFSMGMPVDDSRLTTEPGYPWEHS
jgi:SagB-type dehydrogenase family enzyme